MLYRMIYFIQYVCSMNLSVYRAGCVDGKGRLMGKYDRYSTFGHLQYNE